jgi:hypothetical protein
VSNTRKLKPARRPLPSCPDCPSVTYTGTAPGGTAIIHVDHDPGCPAWHGITPNATLAYAEAEAATGRSVIYAKVRQP